MSRSTYVTMLENNVCLVNYRKVSTNEPTTLRCTLKKEYIGDTQTDASDEASSNITVFNLDKNAYRALRVENIDAIAIVNDA